MVSTTKVAPQPLWSWLWFCELPSETHDKAEGLSLDGWLTLKQAILQKTEFNHQNYDTNFFIQVNFLLQSARSFILHSYNTAFYTIGLFLENT